MTQSFDGGANADKKKSAQALVINMIRALGVFFMLLGAACLGNVGGVPENLMKDHFTTQILGGALLFVGIMDFIVMPLILGKAFEKGNRAPD